MLSFEIPRRSDGSIEQRRISDEMFNEICSLTSWIEDTSRKSIRERYYCIVHNITEHPKCENCSNDVNFSYTSGKYRTSCSEQCKMFIAKDKIKQSCLKKYGVEYPNQSEEVREKTKQTCLKKYGVENASQSKVVKEKMKASCLSKYGVEYISQSEDFKEKMSITLANNFQARRNIEGTDYFGVVYILHFPQHNAVKIGLTGDFEKRSLSLLKDFGEYTVINIIETQECFALESSLHRKFSEFRICIDAGCGRTEFFRDEIIEKLSTVEL
jgi:hypothetical protein